jgi:hypothetical protein
VIFDPPLREGEPMSSLHDAWIDLATRESDGLEVALLWSRALNCVKVVVADTKLDSGFDVDVPDADALSAFYHPFAYAAHGATRPGRASPLSADLQLQN